MLVLRLTTLCVTGLSVALLTACLSTTGAMAPAARPAAVGAAAPSATPVGAPAPQATAVSQAASQQTLQIAPGRAAVVVYRAPEDTHLRPSVRLRWVTPMSPLTTGYHYAVTDHRVRAPKTDIKLDTEKVPAFVMHLLPGQYEVRYQALLDRGLGTWWDGKLKEQRSDSTWHLKAGELHHAHLGTDGQLRMSTQTPDVLQGMALDKLRRFNFDVGFNRIAQRHFLAAKELTADYRDGCPMGPGLMTWTNARFEGEFGGCQQLHGRLVYDDGDVLQGTWTVDKGMQGMATWTDPDGVQVSGPLNITTADQKNVLPKPAPDGVAQLLRKDGTGFLGRFGNGQAHGSGYCFDAHGGTLCAYKEGKRLFGPSTASTADILGEFRGVPEPTARDMLRQRWIDALMAERWSEFLKRLTDLQALGVDPGVESLFFEARAWQSMGQPELARERTAAYLSLAGPSGASYAQALSLYPQVQQTADDQRAMRLGFCQAAAVQATPPCGCREFAQELPQAVAGSCS